MCFYFHIHALYSSTAHTHTHTLACSNVQKDVHIFLVFYAIYSPIQMGLFISSLFRLNCTFCWINASLRQTWNIHISMIIHSLCSCKRFRSQFKLGSLSVCVLLIAIFIKYMSIIMSFFFQSWFQNRITGWIEKNEMESLVSMHQCNARAAIILTNSTPLDSSRM